MHDVMIAQSGRGGSIVYLEGERVARFDYELAMPPAIALVFGSGAARWDAVYPWAAGRQREVFDVVGGEIVRQQVPNGSYELDLEAGIITVLRAARSLPVSVPGPVRRPKRQSPAWERFEASLIAPWETWDGDRTYDLAAEEMTPRERTRAAGLIAARDATWREVDALAALDTRAARKAVRAALTHHLSVATRLAAAEALHRRDPSFDIVDAVARGLRALHRPADGLARALRLAEAHDGPVVRQALMWASWNQTECSSACARLLLRLAGGGGPLDAEAERVADDLGMHQSYFTRRDAFDALGARVGMTLDTTQSY